MRGRIIAIDFDNTLHMGPSRMFPYTATKYANLGLIEMLVSNKKTHPEDKYILWTCRETELEIDQAVKFCDKFGLKFDAINDNVYKQFGYTRKVIADIYIDDRAISVKDLNALRAAF